MAGLDIRKTVCLIIFFGELCVYTSDVTSGDLSGSYKNLVCDGWSCDNNKYWRPRNTRGYFQDMSCSCDELCGVTRDCCVDHDPETSTDSEYLPILEPYLSCLQDAAVTSDAGYLAVNSCPREWSETEMYTLCKSVNASDMMLRVPVTGNVSGIVYRNVYCALCHEEEYLFWNTVVHCDSRTPLNIDANASMADILETPECNLKLTPPKVKGSYRPCQVDVVSNCSNTFNATDIIHLCSSRKYMQLVYSASAETFHNVECALCNFQIPHCYKPYTRMHVTRSRPLYSFSILLDLNTRTGSVKVGTRFKKTEQTINITHTCTSFQVYDPFGRICRDVRDKPPMRKVRKLYPTDHQNNGQEFWNITNDCQWIRLNESEFHIYKNGTLQRVSGSMHDTSEYQYDGTFAYLCTFFTQNFTETVTLFDTKIVFNFTWTTAIVTCIGLCLSLIGLLVTMVIYLMFKTLRNIPGKIILSLSTSLFFAMTCTILAPQAERLPVLCTVVAILIHYFFIDSFLWMNVMAGDVWFTFSKSFVKAGDGGKSSKRFTFYNVYVRGVAIVLITSGVVIDRVLPDSPFSPRYGQGLCWITNKRSLLVFFAGPLFLIILVNMVFFSIASKNIYKAKRSSASFLHKEEHSNFSIYLKLAVVMGLTWTSGFLAAIFPFTAMWYIYIIFNTLQGLFICIAFVFTRKVLHLVQDRFGRLRRRSAGSDQIPSSPTRTTVVTFRVTDGLK